ncbi:hypothetical protein [Methylosinus sp. Ce-a6]|uniref:hypothetical protein n=1 Tax=Methylosinus sp. Ce-a6 TaxID=2172005 RepID=UPI0013588170|nr:hypothetical protein [Methylosinus sp. Ce-a6]
MKSVIGFGSCYIEHILSGIKHLVDGKHIWRATIPSLASSKLKLRSKVLDFKEASDFFTRETEKQITDLLRDNDADAFLFDVAGDFATEHVVIGDTIFPDFRSGLFGEKWLDLSYDDVPELKGHKVIWADSDYYWNMWKFYFDEFYRGVLYGKIIAGQKILFLRHFLSEIVLVKGEPEPFKSFVEIRRRNARLADVYDFISKYDGVRLLEISEDVCFGSPTTPYGGPWEFHPDKEFYCVARRELLSQLCPGTGLSERYVNQWLAENGRERARGHSAREDAQKALESAANDAEVLRGELAAARATMEEQERLRGETERLRAKAHVALDEQEKLREEMERLRVELAAARAAVDQQERLRDETERLRAELAAARAAVDQQERLRDETGRLRAELAAAQAAIEEQDDRRAESERIAAEASRDAERLREELIRLSATADHALGESGVSFFRDALRSLAAKWNVTREAARLRRAKFDEAAYLRLYPDVAQSNFEPVVHYTIHGRKEGRTAFFRD